MRNKYIKAQKILKIFILECSKKSPNKIFSSEFEIILFALGTLQPKLQLPKKEVLNWIKLGNLIYKCPLFLGRLSICLANILFCFVSVENFFVWCSPICSFFYFCFPYLKRHIQKDTAKIHAKEHAGCFLLGALCFQVLTFKSLIHFGCVCRWVWEMGLVSFFCVWPSSFPNTT